MRPLTPQYQLGFAIFKFRSLALAAQNPERQVQLKRCSGDFFQSQCYQLCSFVLMLEGTGQVRLRLAAIGCFYGL